jgi:hypothetical protein
MSYKLIAGGAGLVALEMVVIFSLPDSAESLTWHVRSDYPRPVHLVLYSVDRKAVWPGDGEVVVLDDRDVLTFTIACNQGEQICFGAWVLGREHRYWGVGRYAQNGCETCCYTCGGGETILEFLKP